MTQNSLSHTQVVFEAREKLKSAFLHYHVKPLILKKFALRIAKKILINAYIHAEADYINGKIAETEHPHISKQHSATWKSISDASDTQLTNWTEHLKNLLGKEPTTPTTHPAT